MMNINSINSKDEFVSFVNMLVEDLKENPGEWANVSLEQYLEAIVRWTEDSDGYYKNTRQAIPQHVDWKVFAGILIAAKMYE